MEAKLAKQDPAEKAKRAKAADGRIYFSYAQIHEAVSSCVPKVKAFNPDVIIAIGGGGFIPARMLRTEVRVPILAVSLKLYDHETDQMQSKVVKTQWFDETSEEGKKVRGKRVLIVDEVDDTRKVIFNFLEGGGRNVCSEDFPMDHWACVHALQNMLASVLKVCVCRR